MAKSILIAVYVAAFAFEIVGIVFTVKDVIRFVDNGDSTTSVHQPMGWTALRGPLCIAIGAALGAAGNITSMFIST